MAASPIVTILKAVSIGIEQSGFNPSDLLYACEACYIHALRLFHFSVSTPKKYSHIPSIKRKTYHGRTMLRPDYYGPDL